LGATKFDKSEKISTSYKASIDQDKCTSCGKCKEVCVFSAVEKNQKYNINPFLCEGCGTCEIVCPANAIKIRTVNNGEIRIRDTKHGFPLISAQLYPGEAGSGKIVEELRKKANDLKYDVMILDSAAGIGCPVIASIRNCNYAVLVTEPTPSGFSDLKRIMEIINYFNIPYGIVINKWDIYPKISKKIEKWSKNKFLGKISYDKKIIDCIVNLKPVVFSDSKTIEEIEKIYEKIIKEVSLSGRRTIRMSA